ncbi:hypothetical protein [Rhizomonospora bruguierae]|uniref:hypothetical protein n=1 Tax=Rhizomonospora bruguierae TaxID=1581705 RepID=UPI001BCF3E2B|nr:hypothetical protein [Micromonospora sp. NBRC 107566]
MHDPMAVAFEIRQPWPQRSTMHDAKPGKPRWQIRYHHTCGDHCGSDRAKHEASNPFPWWRPGSYSAFWVLAGRGWYWPSLITIWHVEPGGHDSGEVCKHYERIRQPDGTWTSRVLRGWRWHAWHWRFQIHPFQHWRRRLLTRCEWCGGRSRKGDAVNVSNGGSRERGRWWRGEPGLLHIDCSAIQRAHRMCLCADPICGDADSKGQPYGLCIRCGSYRRFQATAALLDRMRLLAAILKGQRDRATYARVCEMAQAEREASKPA